jgi:hypothetical protein
MKMDEIKTRMRANLNDIKISEFERAATSDDHVTPLIEPLVDHKLS